MSQAGKKSPSTQTKSPNLSLSLPEFASDREDDAHDVLLGTEGDAVAGFVEDGDLDGICPHPLRLLPRLRLLPVHRRLPPPLQTSLLLLLLHSSLPSFILYRNPYILLT